MDDRQRAAQGAARVHSVGIRPEQGGESIPLLWLPDDGQVGKQGDGFACIKGNRGAVQQHAGGAKQKK
jgi:hypothetical protein